MTKILALAIMLLTAAPTFAQSSAPSPGCKRHKMRTYGGGADVDALVIIKIANGGAA